MRTIFAALILIAAFGCKQKPAGWDGEEITAVSGVNTQVVTRFICVYAEGGGSETCKAVFEDRKTGKQYLYMSFGYGAGLCPLLEGTNTNLR